MIKKFTENFDKTIASFPIVLSSNIQKHFIPDGSAVYLKGNLIFVDASVLEIAIFASESYGDLKIEKYRLHYMKKNGQMVFRYDNAPHHPELASYPHHKHTPDQVIPTTEPSLRNVIQEISAIIIREP